MSNLPDSKEDELEKLLDYLYEKGYDSGDGMSKYPKGVAIIETQAKIERLMDKQREQARQELLRELVAPISNVEPSEITVMKRIVARLTAPKEENKNE